LDAEDQTEEEDLEDGVLVNVRLRHVVSVARRRVLRRLHEEQQNSVPELDGRHGTQTHEQEDTVQAREGDQLEDAEEQDRQTKEQVGEQVRQPCFLDADDVTVTVSLSQRLEVDDTGDGRRDQPGKAQQSVDEVEATTEEQIPVVGFTVCKFVRLVLDQVPCDTVIEVDQDEGADGRSGGNDGHPSLSVQVTEVSEPRPDTDGRFLVGTFEGE